MNSVRNWTVLQSIDEDLLVNHALAETMKLPQNASPQFQQWVASTPLQEITCYYPDGKLFYMTRDTFKAFFGELKPEDDLYGKCEETFGLSVEDTNLLTAQQTFNRSLYREECEGRSGIQSSNPPSHVLDMPVIKSLFDPRAQSTKQKREEDEEATDVIMNSPDEEFSHLVKKLRKQ